MEITWNTPKLLAAIKAAEMAALKNTAQEIVRQAKINLKGANAYAFGNLHRSINFSKPFQYGRYKVCYIGFSGGNKDAFRYAMSIERGRRPGKPPPSDALIPWVRLKLRETRVSRTGKTRRLKMADSDAKSKAFLVARAIGRRGTPARPFMLPAFDDKKRLLGPMFIALLKQEMRKRMPQTK